MTSVSAFKDMNLTKDILDIGVGFVILFAGIKMPNLWKIDANNYSSSKTCCQARHGRITVSL